LVLKKSGVYSRFSTLGSTTVPFGGTTTKYIRGIGPLVASEKPHQPERHRLRAELLRFECPELDAVKGGHEVSAISATCCLVTVLGTSFSSVWHQPAKGKLNANGEYDTRSGPEAQTNAAWANAGRDFTQQHPFSFNSRLLCLRILKISMATA
jgi:hypothetical protein